MTGEPIAMKPIVRYAPIAPVLEGAVNMFAADGGPAWRADGEEVVAQFSVDHGRDLVFVATIGSAEDVLTVVLVAYPEGHVLDERRIFVPMQAFAQFKLLAIGDHAVEFCFLWRWRVAVRAAPRRFVRDILMVVGAPQDRFSMRPRFLELRYLRPAA